MRLGALVYGLPQGASTEMIKKPGWTATMLITTSLYFVNALV